MTLHDEVKAYWDRQPCAILHSGKEVGSKEFFADLTARKYFVQPHVRTFADFERWKGKRVLEIGCGVGTDAEEFAKAGAFYTGVDLSPASIEIAIKRFQLLGLPGTFVDGNAECLYDFPHDFPPIHPMLSQPRRKRRWRELEPYDLVYAFGVLHHTPDPEKMLRECCDLMLPDSELRIMVYAEHSWKAAMIDAGLDQSEAQADCPVARRYTRREVIELLRRCGFAVQHIWQDHIFPYQVGPYKEFRYEREPWFEAMTPAMFRALEQKLGWHMMVTATPTGSLP